MVNGPKKRFSGSKLPISGDNDEETGGTGSLFDENSGSGGSGGQSGAVEFRFRDAASLAPRDDVLSPNEIRRLDIVHTATHADRVRNQKALRKERAMLKENGPLKTQQYKGHGSGGAGGSWRYKTHPISDKFNGIRDKQVTAVPADNEAQTNADLRQELQNKLQMRLQNALRFQPPKLRPPG